MVVRKILVPTDFSHNASAVLQAAIDLGSALDASIELIHVRNEGALRTAVKEGLLTAEATDEEIEGAVAQLIESRCAEALAAHSECTVPISQVVLRGDPKAVIIGYARSSSADLIVIGALGISAMRLFSGSLIGSVAEAVLRKSPCPVLLVRPEHLD